MKLEENIDKAKEFLPPEKRKISLVDGNEFEYCATRGMGYSMEALAKLVEMFNIVELKFEDFFGEQAKDKTHKPEDIVSNLSKGLVSAEFRKLYYEIVGILVKKDSEFAKENIETSTGFGVIVDFFFMSMENMNAWMSWAIPEMSKNQDGTLDTEKSSLGVSSTETSELPKSTNSLKEPQQQE